MTDKDAQRYIHLAEKALEMTDGQAEATRLRDRRMGHRRSA